MATSIHTIPSTVHVGSTSDHDEEKTVESLNGDSLVEERTIVEDSVDRVDHPWRLKGFALLLVVLLNIGPNWTSSSIPSLKSTFVAELGINNAQYSDIASASNIINTFVPLVAGVLIDWYGPEICSLVSSSFLLLGAIVAGVGASCSNYGVLLLGELIFGFGTVSLETAQAKIYTYWFFGNHIALVYAFNLSVGRVVNIIGQTTAIPISINTGWWGWSIWILAIGAAVNLLINIVYVVFQRSLPKNERPLTGREIAIAGTPVGARLPSWRQGLKSITMIPACFWLITITQSLQIGTTQTYLSLAPSMLSATRGSSHETAAYTAAVGQVIPIFMTPLFGFLFDRFGKRMYYVSFTALVYIIAFSLLGFTHVNAYAPVLLASVALSLNLLPFLTTIPILVPDLAHLGTAYGIFKCFENFGHVIMLVSAGAIQDYTPVGPKTYDNVFYVLIGMKSLDFVLGLFYDLIDVRYFGSILRMSEADKRNLDAAGHTLKNGKWSSTECSMHKVQKGWSIAGGVVGLASLVAAWIIYLVYSR